VKRTRIKICGVCDRSTALAAAEAGADAIGLVFVERSPRQVSVEQAKRIVQVLADSVEPIALFVDADINYIRQVASTLTIRTIQLHGHETPDFAARLTPLHTIKSMPFSVTNFFATVSSWQAKCDNLAGILLDTETVDTNDSQLLPGGTGQSFNWADLAALLADRALPLGVPMILAGGLTPENVGHAIEAVRPDFVDVSSGVESVRGIKDTAKIAAFCQAVRQTDKQIYG